jgi:hypothetical protein
VSSIIKTNIHIILQKGLFYKKKKKKKRKKKRGWWWNSANCPKQVPKPPLMAMGLFSRPQILHQGRGVVDHPTFFLNNNNNNSFCFSILFWVNI